MRFPSVRLGFAAVLAVACSSAVKQQSASNVWLVPEEQFFAKVDTIGIGPVWVPDSLENPAPVRALFDSLISEQLRLAGYTLVRIPNMREITDSENREHGQFNPATGEPDEVAARTAAEHALGRLAGQYPQVDAFLMPDLVVVGARVEGKDAYWDGTSQNIANLSDWLVMRDFSGTLPAFSVCVRFLDPAGSLMYHNDGGVQVASTPRKVVERSKLFVDAERNLNAVRFALKAVLKRPARAPVT
jgi:hypothetical protein